MSRASSISSKHCFCIGVLIGLFVTFKLQNVQDSSSKSSCPSSFFLDNDDNFNSEFEPQLNLAGKPMQAKKTVKNMARPRYYTSELGIREKLFVAVLSQVDTVDTISTAFNKTVAHLVSRIKYFINADSVQSNFRMKNIVGFTDTRDNLRTYHVLKYIADNYVDDFDYFLLIPDRAYLNARLFVEKLRKISISSDIYMGQMESGGTSQSGSYEENLENSKYCDINAGIILSSSVVKKIRANLDWCVRNAGQSNRHSTNLGKCIKYASDAIQECQSSWQNITIGAYKLNSNNKIYRDLHYLKEEKNFNDATIVYPITSSDDIYLLHVYFSRINLEKLHEKMDRTLQEFHSVKFGNLPDTLLEKHWPIGVRNSKPPETRHDLIQWDFMNETHIFMWNSETNLRVLPQQDKHDLDKILKRTISYATNQYPDLIYDSVHSCYRKFDPVRGMDYILHLNFIKRDIVTMNLSIVTKTFEVVKPLGSVEIVPAPYVTESTKITIIIPVFEHHIDETREFLVRYEKLCMDTQDNTYLMLIFLYQPTSPSTGPEDVFTNIKQSAISLTDRHKSNNMRITWLSIRLPIRLNSENDKIWTSIYGVREIVSLGIVDLALRKIGLDSIVLVMANDAKFRPDFLNRVRMNTISGFQVYSPVSFSNYPCKFTLFCKECDSCDVSQATGYFDSNNFDVIAFYGKDYVEARKALETRVPIVKKDKEFESLFNSITQNQTDKINGIIDIFLKSSLNIHVLRGIEPNLRTGISFQNFLLNKGSIPPCYSENSHFRNQCRRIGSKKQLSEAIVQYEDEVMNE
uniref:Hexosyltransferase n=1 Tax=Culicoides sonorensis TaxID=179676 RepID=A0A336K0T1_CULSO